MTYYIHTSEDVIDYTLKTTRSKKGVRFIRMFRSNGDQWAPHCRGELIGTMTDTGNEPKLKMESSFSTWEQLLLLQCSFKIWDLMPSYTCRKAGVNYFKLGREKK